MTDLTNTNLLGAPGDVFGLRDQPVLVVGGGSGIGRATALLLGRVGARVAVADLDHARASEVAAEVAALGVQSFAVAGNVTDPTDAQRVVDEAHAALGGLHSLINIVGVASWSDLLSMDLAMWESDLRSNLTHHLFVGRAAARHMIADGVAGRIAIVTSISGIFGAPNHAAYGAAKAGAIGLARSMANEWAVHGIRVNSVAPDIIATPRVIAAAKATRLRDRALNAISKPQEDFSKTVYGSSRSTACAKCRILCNSRFPMKAIPLLHNTWLVC